MRAAGRKMLSRRSPCPLCTSSITGVDVASQGEQHSRRQSHQTIRPSLTGVRCLSTRPAPSLNNSSVSVGQGTFVSRFVQLGVDEIVQYLQQEDMKYRVNGMEVCVKDCPFCHATSGKLDNLWKLYIGGGDAGGSYYCHRCAAKGSWYDFKNKVGGVAISSTNGMLQSAPSASKKGALAASNSRSKSIANINNVIPIPNQDEARSYSSMLMFMPEAESVRQYLTGRGEGQRGLTKDVLMAYGVGRAVLSIYNGKDYISTDCITFPWVALRSEMTPAEFKQLMAGELNKKPITDKDEKKKIEKEIASQESVVTRLKVRAVHDKGTQKLIPAGGRWGMFGWHMVPIDATEIVITEGEFDAMAVYQATGKPAVSVPNGCHSLPVDLLPMLERFERIYLWMDNDGPGQEGAAMFAKKLGERRVCIVKPIPGDTKPAKDANDALLKGKDLQAMLDKAAPLPHDDILRTADLRALVLNSVAHPEQFSGQAIDSFPILTKLVKGFRKGELSVMTGGTGSGKTTLLSQWSLDFAKGGVNTLWGSFEVTNVRLMQKMLRQFHGEPLEPLIVKGQCEELYDRFEELPLYFMKYHGGTDIDRVIDTMDYAVYANDVTHIILDNLQFMLSSGGAGGKRGYDRFEYQDIALEKFRKFASERNVHVMLVIHPRKEDDEAKKLNMSSIYGSAKMSQEADLVLILQRLENGRKVVEVKKNRYDGDIGSVYLYFDKDSGSLRESAHDQTIQS